MVVDQFWPPDDCCCAFRSLSVYLPVVFANVWVSVCPCPKHETRQQSRERWVLPHTTNCSHLRLIQQCLICVVNETFQLLSQGRWFSLRVAFRSIMCHPWWQRDGHCHQSKFPSHAVSSKRLACPGVRASAVHRCSITFDSRMSVPLRPFPLTIRPRH